MNDTVSEQSLAGLRFDIEKSIRYHMRRRNHYEFMHRALMFTVIVGGSAAAASICDSTTGFALFSVIVGTFDLVWAPSVKGRDHSELCEKYSDLLAGIIRAEQPENYIKDWEARRIEIEAKEPAIFWAVEQDCYNEICRAKGKPIPEDYKLGFWKRTFKNYYRFETTA